MKRTLALVGFSFAVALFVLNVFGFAFAQYAAVACAAAFLLSVSIPKFRQAGAIPICAGTAALACLLFLYDYNAVVLPQLALDGKHAESVFYLTNLGEKTQYGYVYTARVVSCDLAGAPQNMKVRLYSQHQLPAEGYQIIKAKLSYRVFTNNGLESYSQWGKGIFLSANVKYYSPTYEYVSSPMRTVLSIRYHIADYYLSKVGGDAGALCIGMILGDRSYMSAELEEAFKLTGTAHLTAVSGLHLSAVTGVFAGVFKRLRLNKKLYIPVLLCVIVFYCMLSGFSKSVTRAGIMLTVLLLGKMTDENTDAVNSLGLALLFICANPFAVCDVSTQLTTLCIIAIFLVYPRFAQKAYTYKVYVRLRKKDKEPKLSRRTLECLFGVLDMFLLSASITACTLPVMALFFGYFSLIGIFLNVIIIPLGSVAVSLTLVSSMLSRVVVLGDVSAFVTALINKLIIAIIKACARVPFATMNISNALVFVLGAVLLIIGVCIILTPKLVRKTAVISLAAFTVLVLAFNIYDSTRSHIYINSKSIVISENGNETTCKSGEDFTAEVDGVTVSSAEGADIVVAHSKAFDKNGTVSLYDGGVVYSVKDGRYYAQRNY